MENYENLSIRDHFMFGKICQKVENSQLILRALLSTNINLVQSDVEKYLSELSSSKYVRLDLLAKADDGTIYNAELQHESHNHTRQQELPKRSKYYHSLINSVNLAKSASYTSLPDVYVIFICTFDPFERGWPQYTFKNMCCEGTIDEYSDNSQTIFFNTTADLSTLPLETQNMLQYIETGIAADSATKCLDEEVKNARLKEEWREEYMLSIVHDHDVYTEGYDEGFDNGFNNGFNNGFDSGATNAIISLYKDGSISKEVAISELNISESDFIDMVNKY